jgi:nitrilase
MKPKTRVAAIQAAPVWLDRERSVAKACDLILEAGRRGAELVVFGETWLPTYPYWSPGFTTPVKQWMEVMVALQDSALRIPSDDTVRLGEAARAAGVHVVLGCNEMDDRPGSRTLFNSVLFLDDRGKVLGRHRKLVPTYGERLFHGPGDGADLDVYETPLGRLGALVCGEHRMILARAALLLQGEEIHAALWPGMFRVANDGQRLSSPDTVPPYRCYAHAAIKQHALEGGCFVVSASTYVPPSSVPADFPFETFADVGCGGSTVIDPFGQYIAEPVFGDVDMVVVDCEERLVKGAKAFFDGMGHYSRFDTLRLQRRTRPWEPVVPLEQGPSSARIDRAALRRIADQFEIPEDRLGRIADEVLTAAGGRS